MLGKLQEFQDKDIFGRLKISYDKLDDAEKSILLDIACFFVGKGRENAFHMWKDSRLYPVATIRTLIHKSLIKISSLTDEFEMHDQIQDMAREIVLQEGRSDPGKRSRLWDPDEILDVLKNAEGSRKIEGIVFNSKEGSNTHVSTKAFKKMLNLRLLHVNNTHIQGKFDCFPKKLKWLEWRGCPLKSLSEDFGLEKIVVLNLSSSMITKDWNMRGMIDVVLNNIRYIWRKQPQPRGKTYSRMKVLDLSNCIHLVATPSFSCLPELVKLVLDGCVRQAKIDKSIGHLKSLGILTMGRCIRLKELPYEICKLSCLKKLNLYDCKRLSILPEKLGGMESLTELILDSTSIKKLPESIGRLESLKELLIKGTRIEGIPETIQHLANLELLDVSYCRSLSELPYSIGEAKSLRQLRLDETPIQELPKSIGDCDQLE
ncbi:disease resistance protein RPV1-like isoform X1 [Nymphaea colorata]|nr:disease resistance protein RPV1-like isoform X1 [Nymphaea colorata]XP_031491195.1 disease resistance protein RPV1-like isoform X1 [Nymphaea colorata]